MAGAINAAEIIILIILISVNFIISSFLSTYGHVGQRLLRRRTPDSLDIDYPVEAVADVPNPPPRPHNLLK